jgi:hypothetical protein
MSVFLDRNSMGALKIDKSYQGMAKLDIPLVDDRFILDEFAYLVDIGFKDLPQAVNAEDYVLRRYSDILSEARVGLEPETTVEDAEISATEQFYSDLTNLINQDENSPTGMKSKINDLENEVLNKDEIIAIKDEQIYQQILDIEVKDQEISRKDEEIQQLRSSVQSIAAATTESLQRIEDLSMKQTEQLVSTLNTITNNNS